MATLVDSLVNLTTSFFIIGGATDIRVISTVSVMFLAWSAWMNFDRNSNRSHRLLGD